MNFRKFILIGVQSGEGEVIGRGSRKVRGIERSGEQSGREMDGRARPHLRSRCRRRMWRVRG